MARRKKGEPEPIHRTDLLPHRMNAGKEAAVLDLLRHWQKGAAGLAAEQWRLFFETGRFDKNHLDKSLTLVVGAANRLQMCRWHVVGQLKSWLGNRANEFVECVRRSSLPDGDKHMLLVVNACEAWFSRADIAMKETGEIIPVHLRRLARSIMRHCMERHRRPDLSHTNMVLDQRVVTLAPATKASSFPLWLRLSTMESGKRIEVPLLTYKHFEVRKGVRALSVQVNRDRETGTLRFGVITNIAEACEKARAEYVPLREQLALDFGLSTLLTSEDGGLFGQGWLRALKRYDALITSIARHVQRSGGKPRQSRRYREIVAALQGFVRSEIGRLMNRIVEMKRPARLVVERLDFRNPDLSARMNRLLQNCGRKVFRDKLKDLEQRLGIASEEVNPAYTSQSCSQCGYVDKRNRLSQARFKCLWCGQEKHADVNAGRNIGQRRSLAIGSVWVKKAVVLGDLVTRFCARWPSLRGAAGSRGAPADPRLSNPYFREWADAARSTPVQPTMPAALRRRRAKSVADPALVAA
jgi:putative transposase